MDADTIRIQLRDIQLQLERVEAERAALISLANGFENWLRIYDPKQNGFQAALPVGVTVHRAKGKGRKRSQSVNGKMSVRGAIRDVLIAAQGNPLHSREIWRRAHDLGAETDVTTPEDLVDLNLVSIRKRDPRFKKVGTRTFVFREMASAKSGA